MGKKQLKYLLPAIVIIVTISSLHFYRLVFGITIRPAGVRSEIFLPEGCSYNQALDSISSGLVISNIRILKWVAEKKRYPARVKPGRYLIDKGMSYNELINILRAGRQTPVIVTFNNISTLNDLAGKVGGRIEADSAQIMAFFWDQENYRKDGFSMETVISVFIPDSYQFFWNTGAGGFYSRMLREYRKFWNDERLKKAGQKGLTPVEVSTLASIIDSEVSKPDEKARIAGVYLNRLKRGMPLQADPTVKFALGDRTIKRILTIHLDINSPYNTYKHTGLPPGPIGCPSIEGLDAVLNAESHEYIYFAAKPDFSGYHNFSRSLADHNRFASMYQRELNKRRIFR